MLRSKISLGSTYVPCLAYISSYVLIINFFLLAFFWFSIESPIVEASPVAQIEDENPLIIASIPEFPCPIAFPEGEEKPFLIQHVETIGLDAFNKGVAAVSKLTMQEIEEFCKNSENI